MLANAASASGAAAGFALGGRPAGAAMGLVVLCTAPLLAVAPAIVWHKQHQERRRLHERPEGFGRQRRA
ncbi:hypothetical protein HMPREF9946_04342 [Acetobacteraceae bacterium AT-5844]|nr:hypothetical protein HMPREF9946_04342 [Acetobacteraceae bacterium AT-5844]